MFITAIGLALGLGIGAGCRWFDIPSPAPPSLAGALLLVSITVGFIMADVLLGYGGHVMTHWVGP
jgi:XapX domain-containing protein